MAIQKLGINEFLALAAKHPVLDVRSPGEFKHAHIPGAYSLPLFTDEERKVVGTAYKQQSRQAAIKIGLDYFGGKMRRMVEEVEGILRKSESRELSPEVRKSGRPKENTEVKSESREDRKSERLNDVEADKVETIINIDSLNDKNNQGPRTSGLPDFPTPFPTSGLSDFRTLLSETSAPRTVLVHCWRGGIRSAGVAWLLDLYGFKVYTLVGGYKKFRHWVIERYSQPNPYKILGGYTGSGKTYVLDALRKAGQPVIDLEGLAKHKGSAFGSIGMPEQPTQEMFENLLGLEIDRLTKANQSDLSKQEPIWLEDESQRIGLVNIPPVFWTRMRQSEVRFIDIPFEERLKHIVKEYGVLDKQRMMDAIQRIQKRLGPLETKTSLQLLQDGDLEGSFRILLKYYDKWYTKGLNNRERLNELLHVTLCSEVNAEANSQILLSKQKVS